MVRDTMAPLYHTKYNVHVPTNSPQGIPHTAEGKPTSQKEKP
jgi:hypothetical protein